MVGGDTGNIHAEKGYHGNSRLKKDPIQNTFAKGGCEKNMSPTLSITTSVILNDTSWWRTKLTCGEGSML